MRPSRDGSGSINPSTCNTRSGSVTVLRGTLGHSLYSGSSAGATVEEKLAGRAGVTVELGLLAVLTGVIIAVPIGIYSAIRQYTPTTPAGRSPSSAWRPPTSGSD